MATQEAIVLQGNGKAALVTDHPIPKLRPGFLYVDVKTVALNPSDFKHIDYRNTPGALSGIDYAGVVAETGTDYTKSWKKGDRIFGIAHGANTLRLEDGAFAHKIIVKADAQLRIPDHMSFEDAVTLGVAIHTVGQGLYQRMGLDWPNHPSTKGEYVLIYGGSTAMGTIGIQFAKLSGYKVISTSSPRNFDLVKSMGADDVFDYNDPESVSKIKQLTNNNVKFVWDTISLESSGKFCSEIISPGGEYGALGRIENFPRSDVHQTISMAYTALGEPVDFGVMQFPDNSADLAWSKKWIEVVEVLLEQGKIKPHPPKVEHGLKHLLDGVDLMRKGKVSGQKLVYTV